MSKVIVSALTFVMLVSTSAQPVLAADTYTRLDFIKEVFGRIVVGTEDAYYSEFPDVHEDDAPVVAAAVRNGIANGHDDGLFRPDDIITVEQSVAMVIKFLNLRDHALSLPDELLEGASIPFWITPYLKWARAYSPELDELFEIGAPTTPQLITVLKNIIQVHHQPVWLTIHPVETPALQDED